MTQAAIYVRISSDPTARGLGVARQETACRSKADANGWKVARVFTDNDVSASTGKRRPAYEAMLEAIRAREVGAVIVWDLDRLTRRPIEVEQFIDLADQFKVALASVGGDVDLSTDNGRMFARIKGAVARAEVERKSERQRAANQQRAESGRPHAGRRAFGYSPDGTAVVEAEALEVKRAMAELLEGQSIRSITRGLNERGARTTAGNPWRATEVRRVLSNPRHAGMRVHRGEVVGPGSWPAIVSPEDHQTARAILSDPARHARGRPRHYLLSGVGRCGVCGARLYGRQERRGPIYVCESAAHLGRRIEHVDQFVEAVMVERLSRPDAAAAFARPEEGDRLEALRAEDRLLRARLDGLAGAFAEGAIDAQQLRAGSARLRSRVEQIAAEIPSLLGSPAAAAVVGAEDVATAWTALPTDTRREIVGLLAEVVLHPAGRGARRFDPDTVEIAWRTT